MKAIKVDKKNLKMEIVNLYSTNGIMAKYIKNGKRRAVETSDYFFTPFTPVIYRNIKNKIRDLRKILNDLNLSSFYDVKLKEKWWELHGY